MNILDTKTVFLVAKKSVPIYAGLDNGHQYWSEVRHDLSIMEVAEEDVSQLLTKKCGCCDAFYTCFRMANQDEITLWKSPLND